MGRFRTLTRIIIKINNMRGSLMMDPQSADINQLIIDLKMEGSKPSIRLIRALSDALILESEEQSASGVTLLYYAIAAREWMFGSNPGMSMKRASVKNDDLLILARGHFELWQRMGLLTAEAYHLQRSKDLFEEFFALEDENDALSPRSQPVMDRSARLARIEDMVIYCKVLQHCGEMEAAAEVIANVIAQAVDGDPEYPNHLFVAGAVHKAIGELDKANNYFFEASQIGPPRYFSKLEMMIIISRCIEEGGGPIEAMDQSEDDPNDAYAMVHAHLVLEGQLDSKIDVEDWISDSNTWLSLGDKCAAHQMYSLATDLYGLGIARDQEAFKKPMLWFRFAKACARCGRVADAQLAIKQALTRAPYHPQLKLADGHFTNSDPKGDFQSLIKGEFAVILSSLPANLNQNQAEANATRIFHRLQAVVKGYLHRRDWTRGVGTRTDINSCMSAKAAFVLKDVANNQEIDCYPLLLSTAASWMGRLSNIVVYDVRYNVTKTFPLPCLLCPLQRSGRPRKLSLHMVIQHDENDISNKMILTLRYEEEDEKREIEQSEEKTYYQKSFILRLIDPNNSMVDQTTGNRRLRLRQQGKLKQSVIESVKNLGAHVEHHRQDRIEKSKALQILGIWARENRPTMSLYSTRITQGVNADPMVNSAQLETKSILHRLVIEESFEIADATKDAKKDRRHVIHTNIHTAEIARGGFTYHSQSFLYRIRNEGEVTQISLFHCQSNKTVLFLLMREFIDRAVNVVKVCMKLLDVIRVHPVLGRQLPSTIAANDGSYDQNDSMEMVDLPEILRQEDGRAVPFYVLHGSGNYSEENVDDNASATSAISHDDGRRNAADDDSRNGGYCYNVYRQDLPTGQGVTFVIVDAKQRTIIADNFEVSSAVHDNVVHDDHESDVHSVNSQVSQVSQGSQASQSSLRITRLNDILISPENRSVTSYDSSIASIAMIQPPPSMVIVGNTDNGEQQEQYDTARTALTEDSFVIDALPLVTNSALSPPNPLLSGRRVLFSADSGERSPAVLAENTPPLSRSSSMKSAMKRQISLTFATSVESPKTQTPPLQAYHHDHSSSSGSKFVYLRTAIEQQSLTVRAILDILEVEVRSMSVFNNLRSYLLHAAEDGSRIANYQQQLTAVVTDCQTDIDSIIHSYEKKLANHTETAEVKGETDEEKMHKLRLRISTKFQPLKSKSLLLKDSFGKAQVESESLRMKEYINLIDELKVEDDDFALIEAKNKVLELFTAKSNEEKYASFSLIQEYVYQAESTLLSLLTNVQNHTPDNDFDLAKTLTSTFDGIVVVIERLFMLTSKSQMEISKRSEMVEKLIGMSVAGESVAEIHVTFNSAFISPATNENFEFSFPRFLLEKDENESNGNNNYSTKAMEKRGIHLVQIVHHFIKLKMTTFHSTYAISAQTYDLFRALEDCNQQTLSLNVYRVSQQALTSMIIKEELMKQQDLANMFHDILVFQEISFALINSTSPSSTLTEQQQYNTMIKDLVALELLVEKTRQIATITKVAFVHFEFEERRLMRRLRYDDENKLQQQLQVEAEKMEQHVLEKSALIHANIEQEFDLYTKNLDNLHENMMMIFTEYRTSVAQVYDTTVSEQQAILQDPSTLTKAKRFLEIDQHTLSSTLPHYTYFSSKYNSYMQGRFENQQIRVVKQMDINEQEYAELEIAENRIDEEVEHLSYSFLQETIADVLANQLLSLVNEAMESEIAAYRQLQLVKEKLQREQELQLQIKQAKLELERQQKELFLSQISDNIFDLVFAEVAVSELLVPLTKSTLQKVTKQERRLRLGLTQLLHEMTERTEMAEEDFDCDIPYVSRANTQTKVLTKMTPNLMIKYHKIHSGVVNDAYNRKRRDALVPNLNRRMKRQPVASSLAIANDLFASDAYYQRHPNFNSTNGANKSLLQYEYEQSQRAATFAFDSAEELKRALQGDAGASLTTSSSTLESFLIMPNLHKQPSDHHSRRVSPKKILFSSTLNPAHDHPQRLLQHTHHHRNVDHHPQSAGSSVARSLSSTSWQSGRFSIEKPIVQATNNSDNNSVANSSLTFNNSHSKKTTKKKSSSHNTHGDNSSNKKQGVALFSEERELIAKYADQDDGLFIQSLKEVQSLGYVPTFQVTGKVGGTVQKRPWAYAAHWQRLLADFLEFHARPVFVKKGANSSADSSSKQQQQQRPPFYNLRKKLKTLQRAMSATGALFSRGHSHAPSHVKHSSLSLEEMICGLAETKGSVGGVLVKLQDSNEFISEIRLVCGSLNIRAMVCALPGGSSFFHQMVQSVASPDDPTLNLSFNDSNSLSLVSDEEDDDSSIILQSHSPFGSKDKVVVSRGAPPVVMHVNSEPLDSNASFEVQESFAENDIDNLNSDEMINMSNFSTDSRDDQFNSGEITPPPQILSRDVSRRMLDRPTSLPTLRDNTNTFLLPHLHLDQRSMVVLRKASMVSFRSNDLSSPAPGSARSSLSIDSSAPSLPSSSSPNKLPRSVTFAASNRSLLKDSLRRTASSISPPKIQLAPLSPPGQQLISLQQVSSDEDDSFDDGPRKRQQQPRQALSTTSPIESASGLSHTKKSFRVHEHLVETLFAEHADIPVAILCRRDAIKAQQDQTLLKSDKRYIRAPIENKLTRLASQRSMSSVNLLRSSPSSSSLLESPLSSPMNASSKSEKQQKLVRMRSMFSSTRSSIAEGMSEDD